MTHRFFVKYHPLGVVVYRDTNQPGELLISGESCCGVPFGELVRIAASKGIVEVDEAAAKDCLPNALRCEPIDETVRKGVDSPIGNGPT